MEKTAKENLALSVFNVFKSSAYKNATIKTGKLKAVSAKKILKKQLKI